MSLESDKNKYHTTEKRLYELLGVKRFRHAVLELERIRHRNNVNYHLDGADVNSIQKFTGYLLYNTACHLLSLIFVAIYFVFTRILQRIIIPLDIFMCILSVINLYCIMLQRYTHIKIQEIIKRKKQVDEERLIRQSECFYSRIFQTDYDTLLWEYQLISSVCESIHSGQNYIFDKNDAAVLQDISQRFDTIPRRMASDIGVRNDRTLRDYITERSSQPYVIRRAEKRTARLQRLLGVPKTRNVLFGYSIITCDSDCECAYNRLVTDDSRRTVERTFEALLNAYNKALNVSQ